MELPPRPGGHRALRRARFSEPGRRYLVTTVTDRRCPLFGSWDAASQVCAVLHDRRLWRDSGLHCWVLMPDHAHLLIALGSESLPALMRRVKAVTSRTARRSLTPSPARVWAPAYHDRALRSEEDTREIARYVVLNPVRSGLVTRVGAYPFWNASWL